MLQKIIYKLGVKWRNPSLLRQFESLKKSDKWSIEKLQAYQFERLKTLLQFAYDHSPFYKKEFDEVGFHPSQMTSPDDMKGQLPTTFRLWVVDFFLLLHSIFVSKTINL